MLKFSVRVLIFCGAVFFSSLGTVRADSTVTATVKISVCGNDIAEYGEDCDNADLGSGTCRGLGYDAGILSCDIACDYVETGCYGVAPVPAEEDTSSSHHSSSHSSKKKSSSSSQAVSGTYPSVITQKITTSNGDTRTTEVISHQETPAASDTGSLQAVSMTDLNGQEHLLKISAHNNTFVIEQGGIQITTEQSLIVDAEAGKVYVTGTCGKKELLFSPEEALQKVGEAQRQHNYEIAEARLIPQDCNVAYELVTHKHKRFLGILALKIPETFKYDISEGTLLGYHKSLFWKAIDYLSFD